MGKTLIITEKPSVAQDIARSLGGFKKGKEYYESDRYVMSWAVGHLFELAVPEEMKAQDKWSLDKLPIMPTEFALGVRDKSGPRVKVLDKMVRSKEVEEVINACDAGREGELIFRYILDHAKAKKPVRRLWLQSMTPDAIREGFERLRTDAEMQPLAQAARSRNEADWLIGINATRAFTLRLSGGRGSTITSLGRVQTPTLAMIVDREKRILEFKERALWEVFGVFRAHAGEYTGRWFDEAFSKDEPEPSRTARLAQRLGAQLPETDYASLWDEHRTAQRLWHAGLAQAVFGKCSGKPGVVELEEKKPATQMSPQLYDLTTLQREANNRLGFSAKRTLQIAQSLYEKHKAVTYPRTDSRCLPEDYIGTVKKTLAALGPLAHKALDNGWVRPNKRVFNNAKVSDHFAIIPTGNVPDSLDNDEQAVFDMIAKRFIAVFYPPAQYENTTRITRVEGEPFKTEGKILLVPGWLEVYGKESQENGDKNLAPVSHGEKVMTERIQIKEDKTKPPARFTEATILSAMENAGKLIDDEELAEAMKERGLGTPATRATIIETLIAANYIIRHGKELQPTPKAIQTIGLLKNAAPELTSPEMTGEWEFRLREIEHGKLTRDQFMADIRTLTGTIVKEAKEFTLDEHVADSKPFGECPKCRASLVERFKSYSCTNQECDFAIWKTVAGRLLGRDEFETLLRDKQVGPLDGFHSKTGKRFSATVKLNDDWKTEFDFTVNDTGLKCEKCGKPLFIRQGRRGEFLACSGYPDCKNAMSFKRDDAGTIVPIPREEGDEAAKMPDVNIKCEKCEKPMAIRMSRRGPFLACTGYPKCKNAKPLSDDLKAKLPPPKPKAAPVMTDEKCDKCGAPMALRKGRFGEFLGCSAYPKCKNIKKTAKPQA
ncbi:MAG: DNA topoisomerase III [Verrucomicrobia bacterium]|nr:DNA topoisomerase III [Verrucomicrobiota bacterium]